MAGGTMLVSLRETPVRGVFRPSWGLPILLGAGLFLGLAFFAGKYALTDLSVWTVFAVQQIGNVVAFTVFARPRVWRQLWAVLRRRNSLVLLLVAEGPLPFVAIILGLQATKWSAILLVVAGTMLVSLRETPVRGVFRPSWGLPILLGAGLFLGLAFFAGKYALTDLSVWTVFAVQQIGNVVAFTVFARPRVWRQLWAVLRRRNSLVLLLVAEGPLPFVAIILGLQAASLGPISLVSAFLATMPLFVFIFSVGLSHGRWRFLEESLDRSSLMLKFTSIVMIVLGVSVLGLT